MFKKSIVAAIAVVLALTVPGSWAEQTKASSWEGRIVVTEQGELLGRVEDLAVDVEAKTIDFVVVSIGSFLVDNNLIAVHPDALGLADDGQYLVINSDDLGSANRFGASNWPSRPDVLPAESGTTDAQGADQEPGTQPVRSSGEQVATISNGIRTSTLKSGRGTLEIEREGVTPKASEPVPVQPKRFRSSGAGEPLLADSEFERMDEDGDGYLSRDEIGLRLNSGIRYNDYDLDGNDGIDPFEFQFLKERS